MTKVYVCYIIKPGEEYGCEIKTNKAVFTNKQDASKWVKEVNDSVSQFKAFDKKIEKDGSREKDLEDWRKEWRVQDPYEMKSHGRDGYGCDRETILACEQSYDKMMQARQRTHTKLYVDFAKTLPAYRDGRIDPMENDGINDYISVMFTRADFDELELSE